MERKFKIINIKDFLSDSIGETRYEEIVSQFKSPKNSDIEQFLKDKNKAPQFYKQGQAVTYLVFEDSENPVLLGYFTILIKPLAIKPFTKKLEKRILRLSKPDEDGKYLLSSFLLAQFGKNYNLKPNERIDGDTLLQIAEEKMYEIKTEIGGVLIFLECEDSEEDVLLNFYLRNHYQVFGERQSAKNKKLYRLLKQI